uniref:PGG domain-containing protein n=1 Tax=Aegilops tauschii subsp. strangulata TaxID=200361 RepID=A0A453RD54_AEGTS
MAGDPILLTTNPGRYKAFFYCNSVAFVASLVAIILVQNKLLLKTHVLEAAMVLDLFGLIGAYAAGSCRDVSTSIYAMALAGGVLVYVVIHVVFFTLDHTDTITPQEIEMVEKRRKRLLLFAVLAATVTYQAGLTPPGGFRLHDDESGGFQAGDPVLLNNFPRRYTAYFYCNSVSFMLSIALIILLVNPHLYRPAIRSYALAICTAVGMFGLMGAYAAGSTQHLKTSIYIFALVVVVLFVIAALFLLFLNKNRNTSSQPKPENGEDVLSTRKILLRYRRRRTVGISCLAPCTRDAAQQKCKRDQSTEARE